MSEAIQVENEYRIKKSAAGFEPQMRYLVRGSLRWFALNFEGFWADPDEWNEDKSTSRFIVGSRTKAERVIARAKAINGDALLRVQF